MYYTKLKAIIMILISSTTGLITGGCRSSVPTTQQFNTGMIYMFPGIEGNRITLCEARRAFRNRGIKSAILTHKWKYPFFLPAMNLIDYKANQKQAQEVANKITEYHKNHPNQPIDLVGYSGGGGLAVLVVENLPEDIHPRNIILVQAAISPEHNLTKVLKKINGKMINICSQADWLFLGMGTRVLGTIDRKMECSAGMNGFNLKKSVPDKYLRKKLVQKPWHLKQLKSGRWGGHLGIMAYHYNLKHVAPWLLVNQETKQ
jgi:hypothetical protein